MKSLFPSLNLRLGGWFVVLLFVSFVTGCRSSQSGAGGFASVMISERSAGEIRTAAVSVFTEHGYEAMFSMGDELLFEKEGSRANEIAHGGWLDSAVRERVRGRIVFLSPGKYQLQCQAYHLRSPGDRVLQEEVKLKNFRRPPYQKLLKEVAARLK